MSDMTIWEPMRDLMSMRDWMDNAMNEFWGRNRSLLRGYDAPAVDMFQTENDVVVKATLPGVKADDVKVTVSGDVLTIRGEIKREDEIKNATYHMKERSYGSFSRSIALPTSVVADRAHAEFVDGILTLTLPKAEEIRPKTIQVRAK